MRASMNWSVLSNVWTRHQVQLLNHVRRSPRQSHQQKVPLNHVPWSFRSIPSFPGQPPQWIAEVLQRWFQQCKHVANVEELKHEFEDQSWLIDIALFVGRRENAVQQTADTVTRPKMQVDDESKVE